MKWKLHSDRQGIFSVNRHGTFYVIETARCAVKTAAYLRRGHQPRVERDKPMSLFRRPLGSMNYRFVDTFDSVADAVIAASIFPSEPAQKAAATAAGLAVPSFVTAHK